MCALTCVERGTALVKSFRGLLQYAFLSLHEYNKSVTSGEELESAADSREDWFDLLPMVLL